MEKTSECYGNKKRTYRKTSVLPAVSLAHAFLLDQLSFNSLPYCKNLRRSDCPLGKKTSRKKPEQPFPPFFLQLDYTSAPCSAQQTLGLCCAASLILRFHFPLPSLLPLNVQLLPENGWTPSLQILSWVKLQRPDQSKANLFLKCPVAIFFKKHTMVNCNK